jgi:hypothetical protein
MMSEPELYVIFFPGFDPIVPFHGALYGNLLAGIKNSPYFLSYLQKCVERYGILQPSMSLLSASASRMLGSAAGNDTGGTPESLHTRPRTKPRPPTRYPTFCMSTLNLAYVLRSSSGLLSLRSSTTLET